MYKILALSTRQRSGLVRTNRAARRLPQITLNTGVVVKLHPGRSLVVTREVIDANKNALELHKDVIRITELVEASEAKTTIVEAVSSAVEATTEESSANSLPEPVEIVASTLATEVATEIVAEVPAVEEKPVVEKPAPKKRSRKRKSRAVTVKD